MTLATKKSISDCKTKEEELEVFSEQVEIFEANDLYVRRLFCHHHKPDIYIEDGIYYFGYMFNGEMIYKKCPKN